VSLIEKRLLATAGSLAFPRRAGSEGSRRVVELLTHRLEDLGLDVAREEFSYDLAPVERVLRRTLILGAVSITAAGWLAGSRPLWSVSLLLAVVLCGGLLLGWSPWLERLYARPGPTRTANLVARAGRARARRRLVLMAHHDSKSQSLALPARVAATIGAMIGVIGVLTAVVLATTTDRPPSSAVGVAAGMVGCASLAALALMTSGNRSPGGVDNAGSLAIVLELASRLTDLPDDVELIVLLTGAEEDHMVGAMRWLARHREELAKRPACALNFDGAGAPGRPVLITRFGLGRRFAPNLERTAVEGARRARLPIRRIIMVPGVGIDAIPFAHRRIECLTLASGSLGRATSAVHSAGDVADNLDGPTMTRITDYAEALVRRIVEREDCWGGGAHGVG
jgi:acetylornithine deacetylase/succinyl-diaminopimelate desuccinylase-like protein